MATFINPGSIAAPASQYSHGVVHDLPGRRLVVSGQLGIRPDGSIPEKLEEQIEVAWDNLIAVLVESGFTIGDIVKLTAFCTVPNSSAIVREVRARRLGGHAPAATFLQVAGLASDKFLFEIEGEAVRAAP